MLQLGSQKIAVLLEEVDGVSKRSGTAKLSKSMPCSGPAGVSPVGKSELVSEKVALPKVVVKLT